MVQQIKLQSGVRSIRFGNAALMQFEELTGRKILNAELDDMTIKEMVTLAHCGLKDAARLESKDFDLSIEDVAEELNEPGAMSAVMKCFMSAMPALMGTIEGTTGKKQKEQANK